MDARSARALMFQQTSRLLRTRTGPVTTSTAVGRLAGSRSGQDDAGVAVQLQA